VGRCANLGTKVVHGGCFIEGTLVTVSSLPGQSTSPDSLWSDPSWLDEPSQETPWLASDRYASVATRTELQVPIESVPIGARVPTKNPNRSEVDPQPEPDQTTWAKVSITLERSDGGIVDAEIIRPRSWILESGLCAGRMLPLNLPELEVSRLALVTAIVDCPPIAGGEGSVVTARFVTREVHVVASVDVQGADGTVETTTGTTIHPVWSVDRQSWVPLAELAEGETLQGLDGLAVVLGLTLSRVSQPVYNIEVHGEHVYQVGELGLVVHNVCDPELLARWGAGSFDDVTKNVTYHFREHAAEVKATDLSDYMRKAIQAMESRRGRGELVEGFTQGVRRFRVHGVDRYVDVDSILEKVISFGAR